MQILKLFDMNQKCVLSNSCLVYLKQLIVYTKLLRSVSKFLHRLFHIRTLECCFGFGLLFESPFYSIF